MSAAFISPLTTASLRIAPSTPLTNLPDASPPIMPLVGTWEPGFPEEDGMVVKLTLNISCDTGEGWSALYTVSFPSAGRIALQLPNGSQEMSLYGWRADPGACEVDFSHCKPPEYPAGR